jgi:putative Holliday junction resolvase
VRFLAIDLGERRTGLAVGDDVTGIVTPLSVIELPPDHRLLEAIADPVRQYHPAAIVLGLPLNMDDTEGEPARSVRAFGRELETVLALPVHYQDERLTTYAADQRMARSGRTRRQKKRIRDALSAAEILRDFLDARA